MNGSVGGGSGGGDGIHQVVFTSALLAFVLSVFEFLFTYFYLIPTFRKTAQKKIGGLGAKSAESLKREIPDELARDAVNSYVTDFQEITRYTLTDVISEEKQFYNFERVQFSLLITASLAAVVIGLRLRWGPEKARLNANTFKGLTVSLLAIGVFQLLFFLFFTRRYKTWDDTEILHYLLTRIQPVLSSNDRILCPPPPSSSATTT